MNLMYVKCQTRETITRGPEGSIPHSDTPRTPFVSIPREPKNGWILRTFFQGHVIKCLLPLSLLFLFIILVIILFPPRASHRFHPLIFFFLLLLLLHPITFLHVNSFSTVFFTPPFHLSLPSHISLFYSLSPPYYFVLSVLLFPLPRHGIPLRYLPLAIILIGIFSAPSRDIYTSPSSIRLLLLPGSFTLLPRIYMYPL